MKNILGVYLCITHRYTYIYIYIKGFEDNPGFKTLFLKLE